MIMIQPGWVRATLAVLCGLHAAVAFGAVVPGAHADRVEMTEQDGQRVVTDRRHHYRLPIPAPYWRCQLPEQVVRQTGPAPGGGCAPARGVPERLLLVIQNKDAPTTGVSLEKMPYRFVLRGGDDLRRFMAQQESAFLDQMRGTGELIRSSAIPQGGQVTYTAEYRFEEAGSGRALRVVLASFLVRPPDQDVVVYQLQAFTPAEWHPVLEDDFQAMIRGFAYTGETAGEFFVPDAPDERVFAPHALERPGLPRCGEGLPGIVVAMAAVLVVYMLVRKKMALN